MKNKQTFPLIIKLIILIILALTTKKHNIFLIVLNYSFFKFITSFYLNITFKTSKQKATLPQIIALIIFMNIIFILISIALGFILENLLCIPYLTISLGLTSLSFTSYILVHIFSNYLQNITITTTYKTFLEILILIINLFLIITPSPYQPIHILFLILILTISSNLYCLSIYILYIDNNKKNMPHHSTLKKLLFENYQKSPLSISTTSIWYLSIVLVFYFAISRYGYSYHQIGIELGNVYLFGYLITYTIIKLIFPNQLHPSKISTYLIKILLGFIPLIIIFTLIPLKHSFELLVLYPLITIVYLLANHLLNNNQTKELKISLSCGIFLTIIISSYLIFFYADQGKSLLLGQIISNAIACIVIIFNQLYFIFRKKFFY